MSQDLTIERRCAALWLTINREERRNAINADVLEGIGRGIELANASPDVRVIVLTGAGDKAFCAGGDLQTSDPFSVNLSEPYAGAAMLFRKAKQSIVPMIARVNGACMAGGVGLLSMCDLAVAARHAKFALPEVKVGIFPGQVLSVLQHLIPRRRLNELCLLGDPITAEEAAQCGLINAVADDLDAAVADMIARIQERSPAALRRGIYMMKKMETMAFEEAAAFAETQVTLLSLTEDAKEGRLAFQEKRKPVWKGR